MKLFVSLSCVLILACGALLILSGCETTSATEDVYVTPDSVSLVKWQTAQFTAHGGFAYTWSLSDETLGTLSTRRGNQTVYTSTMGIDTNSSTNTVLIQTLTVTTSIQGGASSNALSQTAQAIIRHL